ncbi:MAG TPA: magnesium/cobalt transporter CorA [Planctomycetota bacterium]|nr:magnesium/cobalt transporter CorA [Planctomycetota bacterium]
MNLPFGSGHRSRRRRRRTPIGASPGLLQADPEARPSVMSALAFGPSGMFEQSPIDATRIGELRAQFPVVWIDVSGLGDLDLLRRIGDMFGLHQLALADVVSLQQRAKVEDYGGHEFLVVRMVDHANTHETEQFAMFIGPGFVLTFQERPGDCFGLVRQRARDPAGQMRKRGSDYLAYALFDAVVDAFFPVLEDVGDWLQRVEDAVLGGGEAREVMADLHAARRCILSLRRALWPLREVTSSLARGETKHFSTEVRPYLRDVQDHVVQLLDLLENHREMSSSLLDLHLSSVNHRLNEVMKVLTIIATIFIPLSFVVGVYGMNFKWMPELQVWWGYPAVMAIMLVIAAAMLLWFRRRRWI